MFGNFFTDIWSYFFPKKVSFNQMTQTSIIDPESTKSTLVEQEALKEKEPDKSLKLRNKELEKAILERRELEREEDIKKEKEVLERKKIEEEEEIKKEKSSGKLNLSPSKKSFADLSSFAQEEDFYVGNTDQEDAIFDNDEDFFIDLEEIEFQRSLSPVKIEEPYIPSAETISNTTANSLLGKTSPQLDRK